MAAVTSAVALGGAAIYSANKQAKAAKNAAKQQAQSGADAIEFQKQQAERGLEYLNQYQPLIDRGLAASDFLANPQAQFDYLQNNPLYQLALDEANAQTRASGAATGRLGAGDTRSEFARNVLLQAVPLLDRQRQDIGNILNIGTGINTSRANTLQGLAAGVSPIITDIGASNAAGTIGAANARAQGLQNLFGLFGQFAGGGAFGSELQGIYG